MLRINWKVTPEQIEGGLGEFWDLSARKLTAVQSRYDFSEGAPVITREGKYTSRGWTEWTLGFHYGSALLQFDATGDESFLEMGREGTAERMLHHVTHMGVHDHGFNVVSTFGNLRRLVLERRLPEDPWERRFCELALRCSAAVQARRWTGLPDGGGYIYSFNGPHSLFADTIRSLRSLALGHLLGHALLEEGDRKVPLLDRLIGHARTTARYNVYYGEGRDAYDVRGRVAHESIFNTLDGSYRCPSTQQGYSSRSTWTRGLAWIVLGYAEELEFLEALGRREAGDTFPELGDAVEMMARVGQAAADYYIESSPANGIPYWDTGAPGLALMPDCLEQPADPFNDYEPVDSSAAAIASQGLLRLGRVLSDSGRPEAGDRYWQAGLTVVSTLLSDPYLSRDPGHEGLLLHSVYHRPNGWDFIPEGRRSPCGESSMWGDYHLREVALYLRHIARQEPYYNFWGPNCDE